MTADHVFIQCTGTRKRPHRRSSVALFRASDAGRWEEVPTGTADYYAAWDEAGADNTMAAFDALDDHPGRPTLHATQADLVGVVTVPEDMPSVEAYAYWLKQDVRTRYEFTCSEARCRLHPRATDEQLFPILSEQIGNTRGAAYLDLSAIAAILGSNRS